MTNRTGWVVAAVLALLLVGVVTLNIWGLLVWGEAVDYVRFGTWSDAISGFGTMFAVVVALLGLYFERAAEREARAAEHEEAEKKATELETAVFSWLVSNEIREKGGKKLEGRLWDLRVQNSTVAPIYFWKLTFESLEPHFCNVEKRPLLPGDTTLNVTFLDDVDPASAPEVTLYFESQSGQFWRRTGRGVLSRATAADVACEHQRATQHD